MGHYASEMGFGREEYVSNEKRAAELRNHVTGRFHSLMRDLQCGLPNMHLTKDERSLLDRLVNQYFDGREYK